MKGSRHCVKLDPTYHGKYGSVLRGEDEETP